MDRIERDYEYDDLLLWRKLANTAVKLKQQQEKKAKAQQPQQSRGLLSYFWGSSSAPPLAEEEQEAALADLYAKIGFDASSEYLSRSIRSILYFSHLETESQEVTLYPPGYVKTQVSFSLKTAGLR
jgi:hypothetical protein